MTFFVARRAFLGILSLCYFFAFASLAVQIRGLAGAEGIQPAARFLDAVGSQLGVERFWWVPTLCWVDAGDGTLLGICLAGALLALLLLAGFAPIPLLVLLWILHLSIQTVGGVFLHFQWDALLLEAGFLAIFLAPSGWRPGAGTARPPSPVVIFLFHLLLFRLMVSSGAVKLLSGDPTWWSLTALPVHYETQPLPTWVGWWAFQLPEWIHRVSVAATLVIELGVPWTIWLGRRARRLACTLLVGLQLLIALTGNYGYFNLLTIGLCLLLLDDHAWPRRWWPARFGDGRPWPALAVAPLAAVVLFGNAVQMTSLVGMADFWPPELRRANLLVRTFGVVNGYGLFAVMTTERSEIVIEGSADGKEWRAWELPWKPGDPAERPRFVAPHMPRLDWQLWFAALGEARGNSWFLALAYRLLEGSRPVGALFANDPFPDDPPRFVRARIRPYHFTGPGDSGWWRREDPGRLYLAPVSLPESSPSRASDSRNGRSPSRKSIDRSSSGAVQATD